MNIILSIDEEKISSEEMDLVGSFMAEVVKKVLSEMATEEE